MKYVFLTLTFTAVFFVSSLGSAGQSLSSPDLQSELIRLDQLRQQSSLDSHLRRRLAELYYLTSRCKDLKKVLETQSGEISIPSTKTLGSKELSTESDLLCSCDNTECNQTDPNPLNRFEALVVKRHRWKEPGLQNLWRKLRDQPEAKYWATKALLRERSPASARLRASLEEELQSFNLYPEAR